MFAIEIANHPLSERPHCCRFYADLGLEGIGLEEWKEFQKIDGGH